MPKDYIDLPTNETFVNFDCTETDCRVHIHAKPIDAICICGAAISAAIETYFKCITKAGLPAETGIKPLVESLTDGLDNAGFEVEIEITPKDED